MSFLVKRKKKKSSQYAKESSRPKKKNSFMSFFNTRNTSEYEGGDIRDALAEYGENWKEEEEQKADRNYKVVMEAKFEELVNRVHADYSKSKLSAGDEEDQGLNKDELKNLFRKQFNIEMSDSVFDSLFNLMDCDNNGTVDQSEFAVTMCFVLFKGSAHDKVELAYRLFDTNKNGSIDKQEFSDMIAAVLGPKLKTLMSIPAGKECFQKYLETEYAEELLKFYIEMEEQNKIYSETGLPMSIAEEIVENYIKVDSEFEVNIEGSRREKIISTVQELKEKDEDKVPFSLFDYAIGETINMLEGGALQRFKKAMREYPFEVFTNQAWEIAGLEPDETMSLEVFRSYAEKTPNLFQFLEKLADELEYDIMKV